MNQDSSLFSEEPSPTTPGASPHQDDSLFSQEPAPAISKLESFGRGAANNFPLAPQAIAALEPGHYSQNLEEWNQKAAQAKAANPKTYGVGAVGGAVAPLLIPGVGEALEAAPLAGNAALGAANALSNVDLTKNPAGLAKDAAIGAGIGGAMGAVGEGISGLMGKAGAALEPAAKRIEAQTAMNALDVNPRALYNLAKKQGENPEAVALNINKKLRELFPGAIGLNDTAASKYEKLLQAHDAASDTIGSVIEAADKNLPSYSNFKFGKFKELQNPYLPEVTKAINQLKSASSKYTGLKFEDSVQSKAILDDAQQMLVDLQKQGKLNFKNISLLKQEIGQIYHNPNNVVHGVDQTYAILSDTIDNILDRVSVANPELKSSYNQAKDVFKFTSDLLPAMGRGVSREVAGKTGSLTNTMLGAGAVFGHPLAAGAGYAAKTAAHLAFPELPANLSYKAVNALKGKTLVPPHTKQAINQAVQDYLINEFQTKKNGH